MIVTIDCGNTTGLAYWNANELAYTAVLSKYGTKGKYKLVSKYGKEIFNNLSDAVYETISRCKLIIVEEGFGRFSAAIKSQTRYRTYFEALAETRNIPFKMINVSEWRRCIKDECQVTFPRDSKSCKKLAVKLAKELTGHIVSEDEADAILLGIAAQRTRKNEI